MTPADLSLTVLHAVRRAVDGGALAGPVPDSVEVARPRPGGRGDYATGVALRLAGPARRSPRDVAEILRTEILRAETVRERERDRDFDLDLDRTRGNGVPRIDRVEITGPGFLNFTLAPGSRGGLIRTVSAAGVRYGHGTALTGTTVVLAPADDPRAAVWTRTVIGLLRAQGADATVGTPATERLYVRPVPAPVAADLFARLGPDAARWGLLRPAATDRPHTGDDLLVQHESNPLFTVRYAHARTRALARNAASLGIPATYETDETDEAGDSTTSAARALADLIGDHPAALTAAARHRAPDRLARHLEQTAQAYLHFQETCRPLPRGDEKPSAAHRSRLALAEAAGTVLAGGLTLLGIDAPEHL